MMKLYHCKGARSLRCLWTLEEMELDYALEALPFPPRIFAKAFKEINPLGTVPALVDGDVLMTESVAICQYLADRYGPTDLAIAPREAGYADYLNWLHRADATLTFPLTLVLRYTAMEPEERRQAQTVEDYRNWFLGRWRSVDAALQNRDYLCANRFTLADICVGYTADFALSLGIGEAMTPAVTAWRERLTSRPAYISATEKA